MNTPGQGGIEIQIAHFPAGTDRVGTSERW